MRRFFKLTSFIIILGAVFTGALWFKIYKNMPNTLYTTSGTAVNLANMPYLKIEASNNSFTGYAPASVPAGGSYMADIKLFNVIPVKQVSINVVAERTVNVCGTPFGIKMFSDGVMVVGFSDIYTSTGYHNPAKSAGIMLGDTINSMNGVAVRTNEDVQKAVKTAGAKPIKIVFTRGGEKKETTITAVKQQGRENSGYMLGMWVRDSSAGIGTLTMIDPQSGIFSGLGHSITDTDTGNSISLLSGETVDVKITGYSQSTSGSPGELRGVFDMQNTGTILRNDENGVYGRVSAFAAADFKGEAMPVAQSWQVKTGDAEILTTIDGVTPVRYSVEIEKVTLSTENPNKNMLIKITDSRLLQATGGIVQGMSGSPIIQDGKIVGAVTHVLINDPTHGFAIFAENMLNTMDTLCAENIETEQNAA